MMRKVIILALTPVDAMSLARRRSGRAPSAAAQSVRSGGRTQTT
jgi:hypothetical protein